MGSTPILISLKALCCHIICSIFNRRDSTRKILSIGVTKVTIIYLRLLVIVPSQRSVCCIRCDRFAPLHADIQSFTYAYPCPAGEQSREITPIRNSVPNPSGFIDICTVGINLEHDFASHFTQSSVFRNRILIYI